MSEPDLDELRAQSQPGTRAENTDDSPTLEEAFIKALDETKDGDASITMSARSEEFAAFIHGLEADEETFEEVVDELHQERGREGKPTRQELILSAAWVGLRETTPEIVEQFRDARAERARRHP